MKRLVGKKVSRHIREVFQEGRGRRRLLAGLERMLRITIVSLPYVFICIDALDECLPRNLPELVESLRYIARESPGARIFLTGRPHVKEVTQRYFANAVVIPISPNHADTRNAPEMEAMPSQRR